MGQKKLSIDGPDVEEDIRRLQEFERTGMAVPAAEVKAWIDSWGTTTELPRPPPCKNHMILFSSEAVSDIERVREFLYIKNPDAAARAIGAIWAALERVEHFPEIGKPIKNGSIRQIIVRFGQRGYVVRYRIQPNDVIFVTRIWHGLEARR